MRSSDDPTIEIRHQTAELRVEKLDGRPVIIGYPIVFNRKSVNLGGFQEIIKPEAARRTFDEAIDVRALVDHDTAKIIGRLSAKTMRLRADDHGVHVEIDPPNTSVARDLVESISRGDISGMSFAFRTVTDEWRLEDETPIREVLDMRILEVSPVTFPAYPQTEVGVGTRSALASLERFKALAGEVRPSVSLLRARLRQAASEK